MSLMNRCQSCLLHFPGPIQINYVCRTCRNAAHLHERADTAVQKPELRCRTCRWTGYTECQDCEGLGKIEPPGGIPYWRQADESGMITIMGRIEPAEETPYCGRCGGRGGVRTDTIPAPESRGTPGG